MYKDLDVLCIGGMCADLMIRPVGKFIFDADKSDIDTLDTKLGGDAANESIIFGRYGMKVGLAGELGEDATGKELLDYMHESNVDTSNIILHGRTRTSVVMIQPNGDRSFLSYGREQCRFGRDDLDLEMLKHTRMVAIGSIHILPTLDEALADYFKAAKEAGVITAADLMMNTNTKKKVDLMPVFANTDYLLPSFIEAQELTGEDTPEKQAERLLSYGIKNVVIKLGEEGCLVKNAEEEFRVPIFPAKVVDTTGAGDNFVASFLTGVLKGWSLKKCATFASAAGSIAVQGVGATTCVKSMEQVFDVMKAAGRYIED
ncbi:sugar kinase [Anaerolentibacter hominis]|uniref:carbohydrate kinase family protein n=1 Tax=Anaerolentibacter hominis TaxID=3079009 RepID=UPI0031B849E8